MSLRFIIGRAGSGKTEYCFEEILQQEHAILLVPEQYSLQANKELIQKTKGKRNWFKNNSYIWALNY